MKADNVFVFFAFLFILESALPLASGLNATRLNRMARGRSQWNR